MGKRKLVATGMPGADLSMTVDFPRKPILSSDPSGRAEPTDAADASADGCHDMNVCEVITARSYRSEPVDRAYITTPADGVVF